MKTAGDFVQKDMKIAGHSNAVNLSTVAVVINLNPMMPIMMDASWILRTLFRRVVSGSWIIARFNTRWRLFYLLRFYMCTYTYTRYPSIMFVAGGLILVAQFDINKWNVVIDFE